MKRRLREVFVLMALVRFVNRKRQRGGKEKQVMV